MTDEEFKTRLKEEVQKLIDNPKNNCSIALLGNLMFIAGYTPTEGMPIIVKYAIKDATFTARSLGLPDPDVDATEFLFSLFGSQGVN